MAERRGEQLELLTPATRARSVARSGKKAAPEPLAEQLPIARVLVDTGLAHLDRPFDYAVPASMGDGAQPGVRVKVRFAGRDLDGFVIERAAAADHDGRLTPIRRVVSAEPVLTPAVLAATTRLAADLAGPRADVLRLAIPPRHARAEAALAPEPPEHPAVPELLPGPWSGYAAGAAFLTRLASGGAPGASWLALPGQPPEADWPMGLAAAALAALSGGRGTLIVVPDARDVARVDAALSALLGPGRHVRLEADQGPQARYTAWLKVLRGHVPIVIGTRAAAFAPVRNLGLIAWWDDGDDLHDEPRSPYPRVRDIALCRASIEGAALLSGGFTRSTAVADLVEAGTLRPLTATPATVRAAVPRVHVAGDDVDRARDEAAGARLPSVALRAARTALESGPVLIQVPRRGYLPSLSCQECRTPARCAKCHGPLSLPAAAGTPQCRWCGTLVTTFRCPVCDGSRLRASVVGARRTAEELGRAFQGTPVHTSGGGSVLDRVSAAPSLVISTPGAEPVAEGGYRAALLLDAWALLDRPALDAGEEALRRWLAAAALARSDAHVVLVGAPTHTTLPAVEALVRWDPAWFAERELADRRELGLPPAAAAAMLSGPRELVASATAELVLPAGAQVLTPHATGQTHRAVVLAPREAREELAAAVARVRAERSARKEPAGLTMRMDPRDPGA